MDTIECILTRKSVRKFENKKVPKEIIKKIIECAIAAPSARNTQPWKFIIIDEKNILEKIPLINPNAPSSEHSIGIVICAKPQADYVFWPQDCAAATYGILLSLHAYGLGGVWTGIYPREERMENFRKLLDIPKEVFPFAFIPIGYSKDESKKKERKNIDEMIHYNKY